MDGTDDYFLRMSITEVLSLPFSHLVSGLDEEVAPVDRCGSVTTISGYTEWIARTAPPVIVGWDWALVDDQWTRVGPPRTNVLLVDLALHPYDWLKNEAVMGTVADAIPWQEQAQTAIAQRYGVARNGSHL